MFWVQDASTESETSDHAHTVSFGDANNLPSCDCIDWQHFRLPCKHLCSVFSSFPEWGWDMLNASYTANPLINLDYSCIKPWVDTHEKPEQRLSHYTITPTYSLKGKSSKDKLDDEEEAVSKETKTVNASDIKISGVELEVPVQEKEAPLSSTSTNIPTSTTDTIIPTTPSNEQDQLEAEVDEETADIALQCRDLLSNLNAQLSSKSKRDQITKLKADLEASIRMFQETVEDNNDTIKQQQQQQQADHEMSVGTTDHGMSVVGTKRSLLEAEDENEEKRFKMEGDSDAEGSYISEEEDPIGVPVGTDIEDETVEISTEHEDEDEDEDGIVIKIPQIQEDNDIVPIQTILTRPRVEELTPEQRERKLLAILTAST